jgi:phosphoribosylamine--glycine ligase
MGAYSRPPAFTPALESEVMDRIIRPTLAEMARRGTPFRGVLFAGLMLTVAEGRIVPKLIEFNVRFGDPECQALMLRLRSDLLPALLAACEVRVALRVDAADADGLLARHPYLTTAAGE